MDRPVRETNSERMTAPGDAGARARCLKRQSEQDTAETYAWSGVAGLVSGACNMAIGEFVSVYVQYEIEVTPDQAYPRRRRGQRRQEQPAEPDAGSGRVGSGVRGGRRTAAS